MLLNHRKELTFDETERATSDNRDGLASRYERSTSRIRARLVENRDQEKCDRTRPGKAASAAQTAQSSAASDVCEQAGPRDGRTAVRRSSRSPVTAHRAHGGRVDPKRQPRVLRPGVHRIEHVGRLDDLPFSAPETRVPSLSARQGLQVGSREARPRRCPAQQRAEVRGRDGDDRGEECGVGCTVRRVGHSHRVLPLAHAHANVRSTRRIAPATGDRGDGPREAEGENARHFGVSLRGHHGPSVLGSHRGRRQPARHALRSWFPVRASSCLPACEPAGKGFGKPP